MSSRDMNWPLRSIVIVIIRMTSPENGADEVGYNRAGSGLISKLLFFL